MLNYNRNLVDFSNPESVAKMQSPILNPYGQNNPYANPNLRYNNANPSQYSAPLYGYNPYGYGYYSMANLSASDTARFMIPSDGNDRIPKGIDSAESKEPSPGKYDGLTYDEIKLLPIPVRSVVVTEVQEPRHERRIRVEIQKPEHIPHTPFTREELDPDYYTIKFYEETPLNWTSKDMQNLIDICDKIYVYDKALAFVAIEYAQEEEFQTTFSRERYEYMLRYLEDKLKDIQAREYKIRIVDYKAKYRYRPTPIFSYNEDGELVVPPQLDPVAKRTENVLTGTLEYDFDRGRDELTEEEWEVFKLKAFNDMIQGIDKIKAYELCLLNQHLDDSKPKEEPTLPPYNPNDSISVKLHQMKAAERDYNNHKEFFRHLLRHKLTDVEFDHWWYGTRGNPNTQMTQEEMNRNWAQQMHLKHLQFLNTLVPINYAQQGAICRQMMNQKLREYDNGLVRPDMSLAEYMNVLGYLSVTKPHELNFQAQQEEQRRLAQKQISTDQFQRARLNYFNNFPAPKNPNPYYTPQYGTVDPRYNMPTHYVDLSNTPEAQQRMQITSDAVQHMGRHSRLHTLYR